MKPAEHSKLFVRAVLLLNAAVLWCRGLQSLSHGSLHIWSAGGAGLLQLWSFSSLGGGCSFTSQLAKFSWGGVSTVCLAAQAVSRAELTQPLHLRKVVWALGLYEHTGFS